MPFLITNKKNGRDRRAHQAFKRALQVEEVSAARNTADHLSRELRALHHKFQAEHLGLSIRQYWVEGDLSMVIAFERMVHDEPQVLLHIEFTPLSPKKAQAIFKYTDAKNDPAIKRFDYRHLDKDESVDRLFAHVREHILLTTPHRMREEVQGVFLGVVKRDAAELADSKALVSSLGSKYAVPQERAVSIALQL